MKIDVHFMSNNQSLVGQLFLPDNHKTGDQHPGVVITGAWTTVKEQMPSTYAQALAQRGYAALVFDFRGWGGSQGRIKFLENPQRKTEDINAAINFLAKRPEIKADQIAGLGICASAGYMSDAATHNPHIKSLALVAPWLHDRAIVNDVYGGQQGVEGLLQAANKAKNSEQPVYIEAASMTNKQALMYQAPYYTEENRGLVPSYDNTFNVASWQGWLSYDAIKTAALLNKPALLIHSEAAAIPQGAKQYAADAPKHVELMMLDDISQFDFYDRADVVKIASDAVVTHFAKTLK